VALLFRRLDILLVMVVSILPTRVEFRVRLDILELLHRYHVNRMAHGQRRQAVHWWTVARLRRPQGMY